MSIIKTISPIQNYPLGTFQTQPIISFNGGGVLNITATLTGQAITAFTITNGGYIGCFSSAPTIVLSGTGYTTCTLTNGVISFITKTFS
jgi:hypothetical protein